MMLGMMNHSHAPAVDQFTDATEKRPDSTTFRVRCILPGTDEGRTIQLLEIVFDIDASTSGLVIGSLGDAPNYSYKVATISFSSHVPPQLSIVKRKVE
jgi:hypothetical protein